ncbi:SCAR-like protein 1 [Musa acuminata AAA Group]|uniref:SCAR-like protein 1 n=1 Tax=Musa acuminata AAA Group TaxID=214697 RepID=UPI0031DF9846
MEVGPLVNERSKFNLLSARRKLGFFGSKWRMHSGKTPAKKKKKKGVFGRRRSLFWTSDTMPTIRYRIRNEYGLGGSELYGAADKNDPEALLEGVAAAGLVGLLRQLGDLAEFAAEVFHNLYEEVINTASRGHKLLLQVQQLEMDLKSIGFSSESASSCLSYKQGIDWHCNLQIDHNIITPGDMPHFIMETYRECRGPPHFFKLDKYDLAGAGACLKRYTDPSFFRIELASRLVEDNAQSEKRACKIKKKVSYSFNGESPEPFVMPCIDSRLQPAICDQSFVKVHLEHVKLKPRQLNESVIHRLKNYMEDHIDFHRVVQQLLSQLSVNQSVMMKSTDSGESVTEVHKMVADASYNIEKNWNPSTSKQEMTTASDLEKQETERKGLSGKESEPASELGIVHPIYSVMEEKRKFSKSRKRTECHSYDSQEVNSNILPAQEFIQNGFSPYAECRSENSSDGYLSDEISSELDNYMDALTTVESNKETDIENLGKLDSVFNSIESRETDSDTNEEQEELKAQYLEQYSIENSTSSPGFGTIFRKGSANPSFSDTLGHLAAQLLEENKNDSGFPLDSDVGLGETNEIHFDQPYDKQVKCEFSDHLLISGACDVMTLDIPTSAVHGEAYPSLCTTDSTLTISLVTVGMNETTPLEKVPDQVVIHLDGELQCKKKNSELSSQERSNMIHRELAKNPGVVSDCLHHMMDQNLSRKDDITKEIDSDNSIKEQSSHDIASTKNGTVLHSQKQHETTIERGITGIVVSPASFSMNGVKFLELAKQDQGACFLVKPVILDPESGNVITSDDGLSSSKSVLILEHVDALTTGKTPISIMSHFEEDTLYGTDKSQQSCTGEEAFPDNMHFLSGKLKNDMMQGSMHTVDLRVVPHKSTMSDTQKNVENIKSCNGNTSCQNDVAHIYNENGDQSICSPDVCSFNLELQQQVVADGAYLGERTHKIIEQTCSEDATQLDYSSSTYICTSSDKQALSSPSLIPAETFGTKISSGLEPLQKSSPENLKEIIPEIVLVKTAETFEFFGKESSRDPDNVSLIQDEQQLKSSAPHSVEDSSAKQRSTGIYSTELADKKIPVDSSESECPIDSKASILCPAKSSNDYMVLAEPSGLSQNVSESQGDGELNLILLQQDCKHLEPFEEISSTENELLYVAHNPRESVPHINDSDVSFSEPNIPSSKDIISGRLYREGFFLFQCNCIADTIPQQASEQQPELASGSPLPENCATSENTEAISQIAHLPPIPWGLTKPPLISLVSSRNVAQPPSGSNLAISSISAVQNEPSQKLLATGIEIAESDYVVRSQKSCKVPASVKESYEHDNLDSDGKITRPALESLREEDKQVYDHNAIGEGIWKSTEVPSTGENKSSQDVPVLPSDETQPSKLSEVTPCLNEKTQDLDSSRSQNGAANSDRKSPIPFIVASAVEVHKFIHEVTGSAVPPRLPPLPMTKFKNPRHGFLSTEEKSSSTVHDSTTETSENEKPTTKIHPAIHRPNDPLIEAIVSHDRSKLRKAHELIRSSAMPKSDETGSFLEQIRNKSFSLKPTVAPAVRFKGGPPTNLKVIAILEKANAIRQACAGSDEDDDDDNDEDSWSDS